MLSISRLGVVACVVVTYPVLVVLLPEWWTITDRCPGSEAFCSGVPPLMLAYLLVAVLGAAIYGYISE